MPELLDFNEFCENLKEVTTPKIFDKKKFHSEGLFSEQIFGPVNNYTCQCGNYHGVSKAGGKCDLCGVDIEPARIRRERFAKIVLPIKVVNPLFYDLFVNLTGNKTKEFLDELIKDENSVLCKDGDDIIIVHDDETRNEYNECYEGQEAIYQLVNTIAKKGYEEEVDEWTKLYENIDKLFINEIIVLPPELRPTSMKANVNELDEINKFYTQILMKKQVIEGTIINVLRDKKLFYQYFRQLQKNTQDLYGQILNKLNKKEGLIRGNILGKRIDFSGRAVIAPDPTLDLDTCIIPYTMCLELFKLDISKRLIELEKFKLLNDSIDFVEECIRTEDSSLYKVCKEIINDRTCLLNRQPSLHRLSMLGFKIDISFDKVIKIHPLVCPPYNSDFDGDSMAIHIPISDKTNDEVKNKFISINNLVNPANDSLAMTPGQDIVLGIYFLTNNKFDEYNYKTEYKGKEITESQKIFNECLPENYKVIDYPVVQKELISILDDVRRNYDNKTTVEVLNNVKKVGFKFSTIFGSTLSLDSCKIDGLEEKVKETYESNDIIEQLNNVNSSEVEDLLKKNFEYSYMIDSGARGKWDQVKQIIFSRGFVSNFNGEIIPKPIKNSLVNGLTQEEFFDSTYGCRKGLMDVAINTGASGYLSRKLNMAMINLQIDKDLDDCGTTDYFHLHVKDEYNAKMLIHRYHKVDDGLEKITYDNYKDVIGKTIKLRSPLFCTSHNLCKKCYGDLIDIIKGKFVGVIAAQSLGETNTQMILRTFHSSGVANIGKNGKTDSLLQQDIVADLSMTSKLLHGGAKNYNYDELVTKLFDIYNHSRRIHYVHFECLVSQMMWAKGQKWRLLEDRDKVEPEYVSVQSVPTMESWLLGLAFATPKKHIIEGIFYSDSYKGIIDDLLCGEKLTE